MSSIKKRAPKKVAIDYSKGKIYKVVNSINELIYMNMPRVYMPVRLLASCLNFGLGGLVLGYLLRPLSGVQPTRNISQWPKPKERNHRELPLKNPTRHQSTR